MIELAGWGSEAYAPLPVRLSGKSRLPDPPEHPALLLIQLRALFGVNARADMLPASLGSQDESEPYFSATDLAHTGSSKRNIALVLRDLRLAGVLHEKRKGNQLLFRLSKRSHLESLVPGARRTRNVRWDLRLRLLTRVRETLAAAAAKSAPLRSVEARRFVTDEAKAWAALDVVPPEPSAAADYHGDVVEFVTRVVIPP